MLFTDVNYISCSNENNSIYTLTKYKQTLLAAEGLKTALRELHHSSVVSTYKMVQTTLALFYRLLHVCFEFSEETLSSAVLHGVYYPLCCGHSRYVMNVTRNSHLPVFMK